jgi:AraC-like DNA-binding protein
MFGTPESAPLSRFPVFCSDDVEFVRNRLFNVFGADSYSVEHDADQFSAQVNHLRIRDVSISYGSGSASTMLGFPEAAFVRQIFNIQSNGGFRLGRSSGEISLAGATPVIFGQAPLALELRKFHELLSLRIEFEALQRHVNALVDQASDRRLEFPSSGVVNGPATSSLRRRVFHSAFDLNLSGTLLSSQAAAEIERAIIVDFLLCNQHNYTPLLLREPALASRATVTMVEEYIEANWDRPLDLVTLTGLAKVSARTLFRQFKKERRYSPGEFVRRIRLRRAFELLQQPEANATVMQVALRCGFRNPVRFESEYVAAFGELPSATLVAGLKKPL